MVKNTSLVSGLTFQSGSNFGLRQSGNYVGGTSSSSASFDWTLINSVSSKIKDSVCDVDITYNSTMANATNNDTVGIYFKGTFIFS